MSAEQDLTKVALYYDPLAASYPSGAPFDPQVRYPEYDGPLSAYGNPNCTYDAVRETLRLLQLDQAHQFESTWNPLGGLVAPGQTVAIKPNLVLDRHLRGRSVDCLVTHGSLIRAVVDYVCLALRGCGRIVIGDAPLQMADFEKIKVRTGLDEIAESARRRYGVHVEIADFRCVKMTGDGRAEKNVGDPRGYRIVDFGNASMLANLEDTHGNYRVTCYDSEIVSRHHCGDKNEYLIAGSILEADSVISISKLKTHRKAGITAALKNVVGMNGHKDWLPHHRSGAAEESGDEYLHASVSKKASARLAESALRSAPGMRSALRGLSVLTGATAKRLSRDPFTEGSWYGNDTLWRTVLDLNRALLYADREGQLRTSPQRNCLHLVDAVIAGEGEGPLEPDAKVCGMMLGGFSSVAVDTVSAGMMGFDYSRIPTVLEAYNIGEFPLVDFSPEEIHVRSNHRAFDGTEALAPVPYFTFRPSSGWRGHIERSEVAEFAMEQACAVES